MGSNAYNTEFLLSIMTRTLIQTISTNMIFKINMYDVRVIKSSPSRCGEHACMAFYTNMQIMACLFSNVNRPTVDYNYIYNYMNL